VARTDDAYLGADIPEADRLEQEQQADPAATTTRSGRTMQPSMSTRRTGWNKPRQSTATGRGLPDGVSVAVRRITGRLACS